MATKYRAQESTVKRDLRNVMKNISASSLKIEQDEFTGAVKIVFDRENVRYTKSCARYVNTLDNLRATQLHITYLYRALEVLDVASSEEEFNQAFKGVFLGLEAPPNDDAVLIGYSTDWYDILGVSSDASKKDVINAYRALAKIHHPDVGGNNEVFRKIRKAYDEGCNGK